MKWKKRLEKRGGRPIVAADAPEQEATEAELQRAIDESANKTTLQALMQQGLSEVKVLRRDRITSLIRQAVSKSIENRAAGLLEGKRAEIEEESDRRFRELLARFAVSLDDQGVAGGETQSIHKIGDSSQTIGDGARMDAIEERMEKLLGLLERAERVAGRLGVASRYGGSGMSAPGPRSAGAGGPVMDDRLKAVLEEIFSQNLVLQDIE